ncbi:MAG: peroxiredoxin, partial [Halieaceae bacterium]
MRYHFIVLFITLWSWSVFAQKSPYDYGMDTTQALPHGMEVGEKVDNFITTDIEGNEVVLNQLLKSGPVVILFYRGEWCPVCNRYLSELNDALPAINEKGATVVVISPELLVNAAKMKENSQSDFVFISDNKLKISTAFDVLFTVTEKYQKKINRFLKKDIKQNNGA